MLCWLLLFTKAFAYKVTGIAREAGQSVCLLNQVSWVDSCTGLVYNVYYMIYKVPKDGHCCNIGRAKRSGRNDKDVL